MNTHQTFLVTVTNHAPVSARTVGEGVESTLFAGVARVAVTEVEVTTYTQTPAATICSVQWPNKPVAEQVDWQNGEVGS
ncbi:hypothetical protein [Paractinoplanes toevensis]|uniref:Uncharacterized protein n=1 Tax=Paractinoplanes toevensis TaxID=571911 RepID=A0A919TA48_9ACTN|nr:hypothetical protein [Actinoplanes toevensis]GIM90341.1 hypothetical protein Ato02nite_021340 [Actinoplanes toevensis]